MFFSLVFKEIKTLFYKDAFSKDKILNLILNLIVSVFFIAIEISLYTMLNNKLMVYKGNNVWSDVFGNDKDTKGTTQHGKVDAGICFCSANSEMQSRRNKSGAFGGVLQR